MCVCVRVCVSLCELFTLYKHGRPWVINGAQRYLSVFAICRSLRHALRHAKAVRVFVCVFLCICVFVFLCVSISMLCTLTCTHDTCLFRDPSFLRCLVVIFYTNSPTFPLTTVHPQRTDESSERSGWSTFLLARGWWISRNWKGSSSRSYRATSMFTRSEYSRSVTRSSKARTLTSWIPRGTSSSPRSRSFRCVLLALYFTPSPSSGLVCRSSLGDQVMSPTSTSPTLCCRGLHGHSRTVSSFVESCLLLMYILTCSTRTMAMAMNAPTNRTHLPGFDPLSLAQSA